MSLKKSKRNEKKKKKKKKNKKKTGGKKKRKEVDNHAPGIHSLFEEKGTTERRFRGSAESAGRGIQKKQKGQETGRE